MSNIDDKLFDLTSEDLKNQDINWLNKRIDSIEKYRIRTYPYKDRTIFLYQDNNKDNNKNNNKNKQKNDLKQNYKYIFIIIILSLCLIVIIVIYFLEINCINTCIKKIKSKN